MVAPQSKSADQQDGNLQHASLENENLLSFSSTAESFPAYYMKNASEVGERKQVPFELGEWRSAYL